jgi:putative transposase
MEQQGVRKTYKYKLQPTPEQERLLGRTLMFCRHVYNAALEQRRTWWARGQGRGATYYQQKAELPDLKAAYPEYAEVNAQVLQDVVLRLDCAFQAGHVQSVNCAPKPGHFQAPF